jgi:general stress protein CsbA
MTEPHNLTRGVRRTQYVLLLLMAALATAGFLTESMWLMRLAAWALIAAGLIEMIYRP